MDLRQDRNFFIREGIIRRIRKTSCKNLRIDSSFSRLDESKESGSRSEKCLSWRRSLSKYIHVYIYIFAKYEEESFEEIRNQLVRTVHSWSRNYFRLDKIARLGLPENLFTEEKKKKNAWRTIGEYRCAVIRAYSETWEKKKKKEREKKDSRKRGTGSMEVSGERSTRKLSGIQSGSLLASERQRDARTENKVAAAIGLAPLLLLSRPPRLSLDPTHGGGLLFLNLRRSRNARVAAVFS